jgi:hypothetical protein
MNNQTQNHELKLETAMVFLTIVTSLLGAYTAYLKYKQIKSIQQGE